MRSTTSSIWGWSAGRISFGLAVVVLPGYVPTLPPPLSTGNLESCGYSNGY